MRELNSRLHYMGAGPIVGTVLTYMYISYGFHMIGQSFKLSVRRLIVVVVVCSFNRKKTVVKPQLVYKES